MIEPPKDEPESATSKPVNTFQDQDGLQSSSDIMLSMLLGDFLCENRPPDFAPKILSKLKNTAPGNEPLVLRIEEYDQAMQAASRDIEEGYGVVIPPPVAVVRVDDQELAIWIRRGVILAATLAAAVMGAIFLPHALKSWNGTPSRTEIAKDTIQPNANSNISKVSTDKTNKELDQGQPGISLPDLVPKESIATNLDKPKNPTSPHATPNVSQSGVASNAMKDREIVVGGLVNVH